MPGLMDGKRGLVMGVANDHSIAWGIAKTLAQQGAKLAFTYQGDALAKRVKPLAALVGSSFVLPCDVEDVASVDAVFICESANIENLDPVFADMPIARERKDNVTLGAVLSNSFGFGGTNASVVFKRLDA